MHLLGRHREPIVHFAHIDAEHCLSADAENLFENIEEFETA